MTKIVKMKQPTIGEEISPMLASIEADLWIFECDAEELPGFTKEGFRAAIKIFLAALTDRMYQIKGKENIKAEDYEIMLQAGQDIRALVKKHTGIDTHDLYKELDNQ
jgi:hypothetical protein